jgi:hypothetical protein
MELFMQVLKRFLKISKLSILKLSQRNYSSIPFGIEFHSTFLHTTQNKRFVWYWFVNINYKYWPKIIIKNVMLFLSTFITHNPTAKFMINQCPFLLEALTWVDNNTFLFQHLKVACNFLFTPHTCLLPFEQLIGQQMVQPQNSISECLHHHTFSSMLFDMIFETHHHVQILSCFGPGVGLGFRV